MKKIFFYFFSVILIVSFLVFWQINVKNKTIKKQVDKLRQIDKEGDKLVEIINQEKINEKSNRKDNLLSGQKSKIDFVLKNNDFTDFSGDKQKLIEKLRNLYIKSLIKGDTSSQIQLLVGLYNLTQNKKLLKLIITKSVENYQFDIALKYLKKLYENGIDNISSKDAKIYLFVLLNTLNFSQKSINEYSKLVDAFFNIKKISYNDYVFYKSFLDILNHNFTGFKNHILLINTGDYRNIVSSFLKDYKIYKEYKDTPKYYLRGLLGYTFFNNGYFKIASFLGKMCLKYNPDYKLANQLIAYSDFVLGDEEAIDYLKNLVSIDEDNENYYKFLLGVLYFNKQDRQDSILYLSQIKNEKFIYIDDVYRYLFLDYYYLGDLEKSINYFDKLYTKGKLNPYDFWTFYNLYLYLPFSEGKKSILVENRDDFKFLIKVLNFCYKNLSKQAWYICRYGKGLTYLNLGIEKNGIKYLKYLVRFYPEPLFFKILGDYYYKLGKFDIAKKYYIQGLRYSNQSDIRKYLRGKIVDIILKEKFKK